MSVYTRVAPADAERFLQAYAIGRLTALEGIPDEDANAKQRRIRQRFSRTPISPPHPQCNSNREHFGDGPHAFEQNGPQRGEDCFGCEHCTESAANRQYCKLA